MQKYIHLLERLGMSKEERTIYIALLNHPYMMVSEIARETAYHRPSVYRAIGSLESDGYVEKTLLEGKRYYYHATSPLRLRDKLDSLVSVADRVLPEMEALHKKQHSAPILSIMEWVDGIRKIHDDLVATLPVWWEYYCYSASGEGEETLWIHVSDDYKKKTKNKELSRKIHCQQSRKGCPGSLSRYCYNSRSVWFIQGQYYEAHLRK